MAARVFEVMLVCSMLTLTLTLTLLPPSVLSQFSSCPQVCNCIWRNNKQTTICEHQNLISIPNQMSTTTQVLDLNSNNFQILPSRAFQERGLVNLQKLFLGRCKLGAISDDAFFQLTNLVELDLSENLLTHVPMKALMNSSSNLRRLLLSNNHIATINAESFATLNNLKFLNLSGCQTHTIEPRAFFGLHDLEYLYLQSNHLTSLQYSVVVDLPALYNFDLYRNPWHCNCEMRATREWMIRNNVGSSLPPTCQSPARLSGLMWNSLDLEDFACEPDIITTTNEINKPVGHNATLSCVAKSIPEPRVFWFTDDYRNLSAPYNRHERYTISEERTDGMVTSTLVVSNLEIADDLTNYICSAENRAGVKTINFTILTTPMHLWNRTEMGIGVSIFSLLLIFLFIVTLFIVINGKPVNLFQTLKSSRKCNQASNDKASGFGYHPDSSYTSSGVTLPSSLLMFGLGDIDKKPEIFPQPAELRQQQQLQAPDLVSQQTADPYELNTFSHNGYYLNERLNDLGDKEEQQCSLPYDPEQASEAIYADNDGLYRAVLLSSLNGANNNPYGTIAEPLSTLEASNLYSHHPSHAVYDSPPNRLSSMDNLMPWRATPYDMLMISLENENAMHANGPVQLPNGKMLQYQENAVYHGLQEPPQMMPPPIPTQPIIQHSQSSLDFNTTTKHRGAQVPLNRPVMLANTMEPGALLPSFRYSPDEGYAEEASPGTILQGTEV